MTVAIIEETNSFEQSEPTISTLPETDLAPTQMSIGERCVLKVKNRLPNLPKSHIANVPNNQILFFFNLEHEVCFFFRAKHSEKIFTETRAAVDKKFDKSANIRLANSCFNGF